MNTQPEAENTKLRVLLIEDNHVEAALIKMMLSKAQDTSFDVEHAGRLSAGLERLSTGGIDMILLDLSLPDSDGFETFARVHAQAPKVPIVIMTGLDDEQVAVQAVRKGAQDYLMKGAVDFELLLRSMRYSIERKLSEEALRKAHGELESRVQDRTTELARANRSLLSEITERKQVEETLRKERDFINAVVDTVSALIVILDHEGRIVRFNNACQITIGYTSEEIAGKYIWDVLTDPEEVQSARAAFENVRSGELPSEHEHYWLARNGERRLIAWSNTTILNKNGSVANIIVTGTDITERRLADEKIRELHERFSKAFEASPMPMAISSIEEGRYIEVNNSFLKTLGFQREEVIGHPSVELGLMSSEDRARIVSEMRKQGYARNIEGKIRTKNGKLLEGLWSGELITIGNRKRFLSVFIDITERRIAEKALRETHDLLEKRVYERTTALGNANRRLKDEINERRQMEEKLLTYQRQLQSLASELSLAEERERRRIATELHDNIGQSLALSKIKLGTLGEMAFCADIIEPLEEIRKLIEETIQNTRSLTFELSPPVLYELGFEAAVEWLAEQFQKQHGIQFSTEVDGQTKPLNDDIRILLFTAVRELLLNVAKHSQACRTKISIWRACDTIKVKIEDNGIGFNGFKNGSPTSKNGGFGLFSIRERLNHLGGHLEVESESGTGTRVTLAAPLKQ